jgi:hypothetical protein
VSPATGNFFGTPQSPAFDAGNFFESSTVDPNLMRNAQIRDEALFDLRSTTSLSAPRFPSMNDYVANLFPVDR